MRGTSGISSSAIIFYSTSILHLQKNYVQDGPKTEEMGDDSPGYIGLFIGWRIVEKYMDENPKVTLEQLMQTDPRKIFEESKYKPK